MDEFSLDRPELNGSLISMEFGPGGRIQQLWASDPAAPDDSEEFQFVAPPVPMGEELAEDYFPGTILLGARTHPDDPWILSRNSRADHLEEDEGDGVSFEYDFGFIEEIQATGRFYEIGGPVPQIAWDISLRNRSRRSVEIGELGFPMALNNVYEGFPKTDRGLRELWNDRVIVHKHIGGAASYLFAQRLTSRPPGLLVFPGADTRWEFYNHVRASLTTQYRWDGIPIVYAHSQAAIEREEWPEWFGDHTAVVLEPGETRDYQIRFAPADRSWSDNVHSTLVACGRPAIKLFPAAVAPADVGIALEVSGATPTRFFANIETELETDADEEGGFCFLRPGVAGIVKLGFEDTQGRESDTHLLFTEPIRDLIQRRAEWIAENQVVREPGPFLNAILPADNRTGMPITDPEAYTIPFGVESSLGEALFLAEKNRIMPVRDQVRILDAYLESFVETMLVNPADGSVGSFLPDPKGTALHFGRAQVYPLAVNLYLAMARVSRVYGESKRGPEDYLAQAVQTALALFRSASPFTFSGIGVPLLASLKDLVQEASEHGLAEEAATLSAEIRQRQESLVARRYPFAGDTLWTTSGFEEVFDAARQLRREELQERTFRCAYASRSLAPSWWWYGTDRRWAEDLEAPPNPGVRDKGELCLGGTTVANSLMFFETLDRDLSILPEPHLRAAFGGLLGVWGLVRADGAAGMAFTPDVASDHFGMSWTTGDLGIALFQYLRGVGAYVLPTRSGVQTFGCHFEIENEGGVETYVVRPWDGVGRKVIMRQIGLELRSSFGTIQEVRLDARKRSLVVRLQNPADKDLNSDLSVRGMWGRRFQADGTELQAAGGELSVPVALPAGSTVQTEIKVL
jgi:hypothetical protein